VCAGRGAGGGGPTGKKIKNGGQKIFLKNVVKKHKKNAKNTQKLKFE
jgi:hypothetical protein